MMSSTLVKPIKVLLCVPSLNVGGAEKVVCNLANGFNDSKIELMVCCISRYGPLKDSLKTSNIVNLRKNGPLDITTWIKFYNLLNEFHPQIVHSFLVTAGFWSTIPTYFYHKAVSVYSVRSIYGQNPWYVNIMEKVGIFPFSNWITFVSENARQTYLPHHNDIYKKSSVIRNGVPTIQNLTGNHIIENRPIPKVLIAIGRLVQAKGYFILIRAFKEVLKSYPDTILWIVGDGPLHAELENFVDELNIQNQVVFWGQSLNVAKFLQQADIYVSASLWEGIPNAHLEAMSAGKPIVATAVGGVPEVLDDESAILVPPNDIVPLQNGIIQLIEDNNLREMLSRNVSFLAEKKFSMMEMIKNYQDLYIEMINRNKRTEGKNHDH